VETAKDLVDAAYAAVALDGQYELTNHKIDPPTHRKYYRLGVSDNLVLFVPVMPRKCLYQFIVTYFGQTYAVNSQGSFVRAGRSGDNVTTALAQTGRADEILAALSAAADSPA
jgi:hypothetical protein